MGRYDISIRCNMSTFSKINVYFIINNKFDLFDNFY